MRNIKVIGDNEYHYSAGYYTANKWIDDDSLVLTRSKNPRIGCTKEPNTVELVKFNLKTNESTVLCDDTLDYANHVVYKNMVYYTNGVDLKSANTDTGEIKTIYTNEYIEDIPENYNGGHEMYRIVHPHITNDGKTVSVFIPYPDRPTKYITIDTQTGTGKLLCEKGFEPPFSWTNHGMICPTDKEKIFFAHEGSPYYVLNRIWVYDGNTDTMKHLARVTLNDNGQPAECFGHEMWSPDGKGIYFIKYIISKSSPTGICYVDVDTGKYDILYTGYRYYHVAVSPDGRYLAADTQYDYHKGEMGEIVLIDMQKGTEEVIDIAGMKKHHPCHLHPQFSPNNKRISYTSCDDKGVVCVKIAEI